MGGASAFIDHADAIGSTVMETDPSGAVQWDVVNGPWGQVWQQTGTRQSEVFADLDWQVNDPLMPSATREYSDGLGRWMTPDPGGTKVVSLANPQTWNMYAYVTDNPTTLNDPSGLHGECSAEVANQNAGCRAADPNNVQDPTLAGGAQSAAEAEYAANICASCIGITGTLYGHPIHQTFSSFDAWADFAASDAALPTSEAYVQFLNFSNAGGDLDPNAEYIVQGQRRGFTMNYQVADPDARGYALSTSLPAAFVNDPYGSHGGNWSAYGGNFVLNTFHYVSVSTQYVPLQWLGGEFHSDFFGPLGPLVPFHVVDWGASQIIRNGSWIFFTCSVNSGCN